MPIFSRHWKLAKHTFNVLFRCPGHAQTCRYVTKTTWSMSISVSKSRSRSIQASSLSTPINNSNDDGNNNDNESLYCYTSGRFLWNEQTELAARYVKFNIEALRDIAAAAVGSESCTSLVKFTETHCNKILLLGMSDGKEVIVKIPHPNAGFAGVVGCEVATMDFVRNVLQIPTPKVYAWCSNASSTPVGAEYIIMERLPGVKLSKVWEDMPVMEKFGIVEQLALFHARLALCPFPGYGSLYFAEKEAIMTGTSTTTAGSSTGSKHRIPCRGSPYAVGLSHNPKLFDYGRAALNLDRGPWTSLEEYLLATTQRERESILQLGHHSGPQQGFFNGPEGYQTSLETKLKVLDCYTKLIKHLLPEAGLEAIHEPVLWHPNLTSNKILIDFNNPGRITGILGWQSAIIAPMFLQARCPPLLDFNGPKPEKYIQVPELPPDFDDLDPEKQEEARKLNLAQSMCALYGIELKNQYRDAIYALRWQDETHQGQIHHRVEYIHLDAEPVALGHLMKIEEKWGELVGEDPQGRPVVPCPIEFSDEERERQKTDKEMWQECVEVMESLLDLIGAPRWWDGHVNNDEYENGKKMMVDLRRRFIKEMSKSSSDEEMEQWRKAWPFPVDDVDG